MVTKDDFSTSALKMLLSAISLVIIFPIIDHTNDVSLYVTVSVYVLGKFIDLVAKVTQRQFLLFYIIYIVGIIMGIVAVSMCFYGFASISETHECSLVFNQILVMFSACYCFIDVADFVYCIYRTIYTKNLLHQFI